MHWLKQVHVTLVIVSVSFFLIRFASIFIWPSFTKQAVVRVFSHTIDSCLVIAGGVYFYYLVSSGMAANPAVILGVELGPYTWLVIKILFLFLYIVSGYIAINAKDKPRILGIDATLENRTLSGFVAIGLIIAILYIAARNPWHPFEYIHFVK